jgi:hypothetical protein
MKKSFFSGILFLLWPIVCAAQANRDDLLEKINNAPLMIYQQDRFYLYAEFQESLALPPLFGMVTLNGGYRCCFSLSNKVVSFGISGFKKYNVKSNFDHKMKRYALNYEKKVEQGELSVSRAEVGFAVPVSQPPKIKIVTAFIDGWGETNHRLTFLIGKNIYWVNACKSSEMPQNGKTAVAFFVFKGVDENVDGDTVWSTSYQYLSSTEIVEDYCPVY